MTDNLALIYKTLANGGWRPHGAPGGGAFRAICPSCGTRFDGNASKLAVTADKRGGVLIHCFAGCGALEVVAALGLAPQVLFPARTTQGSAPQRWIDPRWALEGLSDDAMTIGVFAALLDSGNELTDRQRDELAEARFRIESVLQLLEIKK